MSKGELSKVTVKMLPADQVVDAADLPLEQAPSVLHAVGVDELVPHILADAVIDGVMVNFWPTNL